MKTRSTIWRNGVSLITALMMLPTLAAAALETVQIHQARGADQRVRYEALQKYGPWDDRNYMLTADDLDVLAKNETELYAQIPAFFRVELRKEWPHLKKTGAAQYPRAARQLFEIRYGGLMRNGKIPDDRRELSRIPVPVDSEVQLNTILGANEVTIEINPSNPLQAVAGSNNAGGQEMYYSTNGGSTWTVQGVLPNSCCDPTVDWSSDGTIAYAAALSGNIGVSAWRSLDGGQNWTDRVNLTFGGSDKEFIHVDKSLSSPHIDNVYMTYHNGNTMQFGRSVDFGLSYTTQAFTSAPSGIGSDITTTANGDIYYVYGAFGPKTIEFLKSTDGGLTFTPAQSIASTNGSFTFPIPSIEARRAWIYAAVDADRSSGTFDGSVYVSWTDTVDPENNEDASANHTRVYVAYSRDGGATWTLSSPHSTLDMDTVDRWNQWLTVDDNGVVHVVYYDTRHSVDRSGVDLYYAFSIDGGVTWDSDHRVSSQTSSNINDAQEFGDYNGVSVVGEKIMPVWTDNRDDGGSNSRDAFAANVVNVTAVPGFILSANPAEQLICASDGLEDITVSIGSILEFSNPVTLNLNGLPTGITGGFTVNPVIPNSPANVTTAQFSVGAIADGDYSFTIDGSALDGDDRSKTINVTVFSGITPAAGLLTPADNAMDLPTGLVLSWTAVANAESYIVELDDDPAFGSIDFTTTTSDTTAAVSGLATETTYYWRVRTANPCGESANSSVFSFSTNLVLCATGPVAIPDAGGPVDPASLPLAAASNALIDDLNVSIIASHSYVGDLAFTLTHVETGTSVVVIDRPGVPASTFGCSNSDIDVILDDDSALAVETQCAPGPALTGVLQPQAPLAAFIGESLGGTWVLEAYDYESFFIGTVNEWCLLPVSSGDDPDSDSDGVTDSIDNCTDTANADQRDTDGDFIGNACDADINNDCLVNFNDILIYRANFFLAGDLDTDNNGDNVTNFVDLGVAQNQFFGPPGPSAAGCDSVP